MVGPVWQFLDPFSTIHDLGAALLRALHVEGWAVADYPAAFGRWPATIGFAFFVWLELVVQAGPSILFIVLVGYTALTVAMMAQFGRDEWRSQAETFTVWFRLLGRLAHWRLVDEDGRVQTRSFGSGLLEPGWSAADVTLVALGVSSIIFDGLSQTQPFFDLFGAPDLIERTLLLFGFLGIVVLLAFARGADGRARRHRCGPAADRPRLPHRPLPDLPADRRPADPHRHLRPVQQGLEPVRDGVPRADRGVAAAGSGLDRPAGRGRRRAHARGVGRARRGRRGRTAGHQRRGPAPTPDPAGAS